MAIIEANIATTDDSHAPLEARSKRFSKTALQAIRKLQRERAAANATPVSHRKERSYSCLISEHLKLTGQADLTLIDTIAHFHLPYSTRREKPSVKEEVEE